MRSLVTRNNINYVRSIVVNYGIVICDDCFLAYFDSGILYSQYTKLSILNRTQTGYFVTMIFESELPVKVLVTLSNGFIQKEQECIFRCKAQSVYGVKET